ncbi:unnamed protein product [Rhizoctonia solani]|uniref:Uncharacterized protein n=1 Tax=Rhizoctonia solani TaxID=456999 RepID=A0A8H3E3R4_9AGAM|nr:unnamed protein product [Rhizoctonia solani]
MELFGGDRDKLHIKDWLTASQRFPGLEIEVVDKTLRSDIKTQIDRLAAINLGAIFVYMQGHGLNNGNVSYITGDQFDPKEGYASVKSEELINMFSEFDHHTLSVVITDFCYSGNFFRLRYKLEFSEGGNGPEWVETGDWSQVSGTEGSQLTCLLVHLAGSTRNEQVIETERTGGYFTDVSGTMEPG